MDSLDSLVIHPDWQWILESPLNSIHCPHRANENNFLLNSQHWYVHVLLSLREHHLLLSECLACLVHVGLVNGISTSIGYFNTKAIYGDKQWYYLTYSWRDKKVYTFPKSISSKANVIASLEFERAYYHVAVQSSNSYTTATPFDRLIWTVSDMGTKWPCGCCFQDFIKTTCCILV